MTAETLYHVMRRTTDHHIYDGDSNVEIRSIWRTYGEAREAAERDLLDEWSEDFFVEYEVNEDEYDDFMIQAVCPEGEEMEVYVEKHSVSSKTSATDNGSGTLTKPTMNSNDLLKSSGKLDKVYVISSAEDGARLTDFDNQIVYASLLEANREAQRVLKHIIENYQPEWYLEDDGRELGEPDIEENNKDSDSEFYYGKAQFQEEGDMVEVVVKAAEMRWGGGVLDDNEAEKEEAGKEVVGKKVVEKKKETVIGQKRGPVKAIIAGKGKGQGKKRKTST
ncbi:hypothetical protein M231_00129 [Tremella mesenterica]|uniref:Uncharacterized protein n=1 Tax=Tremella mesenterica TaxID=5217 RepID=A0A4Q1BWM2_TREME|nr:hypothetical protein M231_00129 [Tremella mesenterica]